MELEEEWKDIENYPNLLNELIVEINNLKEE